MFRLHSFCADIYVRLFTVCFCCLLFLYCPKMLWWEWPPLILPSGLKEIIRRTPTLKEKRGKKKIKIEKVPGTSSGSIVCVNSLTHWLICGMYSENVMSSFVCLFVCLFSFLCQSVPTHKHRRAFVPLKSCDIIWWCKVFKGNPPPNSGTQVKLKDVQDRSGNKIQIYEYWFEMFLSETSPVEAFRRGVTTSPFV